MCDNRTVSDDKAAAVTADIENGNGSFVVIRDLTPATLHAKGQYASPQEANDRVAALKKAGHKAAILFVPNTPVGDTDHGKGSGILKTEVCVKKATVEVVTL